MDNLINRLGDSLFIRLSIIPGFIADLSLTDIFQCAFYSISIYALWYDLRRAKGPKSNVIKKFADLFKKK
jgi:hypothetical protein